MLEWWEFALRIGCAFGLGALVGLERQWRARMAGLRTNVLVSLGSALFVLLAANTVDEVSPTRVASQVVSGIGFLGAGVILREGVNIRGVNTAATIWCAAAVGVLAGSGLYAGALMGALTVVAANILLRPLARLLGRSAAATSSEVETNYRLRVVCGDADQTRVRALLLQTLSGTGFVLHSMDSRQLEEDRARVTVRADLSSTGRRDEVLEEAVGRLSLEPGVSAVHWQALEDDTL